MKIDITVNGQLQSLDVSPSRRLLDILREDLGLTGPKEGCGEGECGACAVLLEGTLVNACLVPALQLHGKNVLTIEGIGTEQHPDPLQQAFLDEGAVQCGFCTPGMIMASRALLDQCAGPSRPEIRAALAGNLCRCTGYERIIRAVERVAAVGGKRKGATQRGADMLDTHPDDTIQALPRKTIPAFWPASLMEVLEILRDRGEEITVVAGATDLLTNMKLGLVHPRALIDVTRIEELGGIFLVDGAIEIGAAATFAAIASNPSVAEHLPALATAASRVGAAAIQNRATLGGNLISASPAADAPPVLMALDATVLLAAASGMREIAVSSFFSAYRKTVRRPDELLLKVRIPMPEDRVRQAFYKVGTRRAQSISKVAVACLARVGRDNLLARVRMVAGSVAPTAIVLEQTQDYLEGRKLTREVAGQAGRIASREIRPIDDVRSTEGYRRATTGRLVSRFLQDLMAGR